jgi:hypothetical protein
VISKIIFLFDFLDELGFFIGEKSNFYEKSQPLCREFMAVQLKNFVRQMFEISFQVRDFYSPH